MKKHLTAANRGAIEILLSEDFTLSEIAGKIGVHKSTISREMKRHGTPRGYFAETAQINADARKKKSSKNASKIMHSSTRNYILSKLSIGWSPEQISGRMKLKSRNDRVCHETIYRFIYEDEYCKEEKIFQYLRRGHKKRKKQTGRSVHKSKIPNRTSITQRPEIVKTREEFGHWEGDSVIYPYLKAINTVNELKTGYVVFTRLERKTADLTAEAMIKVFNGHYGKTLTLDNGSEFTNHDEVSSEAGVDTYFCHPYSSWERGANENCNMLLRGYLPKRYNINDLKQEELEEIARELNNRPRKRLGYLTPPDFPKQVTQ